MDTADDPTTPVPNPRFAWRSVFHRTETAVFVIGANRRLQYANPAWERATRADFQKLRGMRISARRSAGLLSQSLAPPAEVWAGREAQVRRIAPDADTGPPWWDFSFLPLPDDQGRILAVLGTLRVHGEFNRSASAVLPAIGELRRQHAATFPLDLFTSQTPDGQRLGVQIRHAATSLAPVWIIGEPGTGKETLARVIHQAGPGRDRPFVALDCESIQPYLLESILFGKGGILAGGISTVFLKYPARLPRDLQQRLVETWTAPESRIPRVISASGQPAIQDVQAGQLIPEFHTQLSVWELTLPPLRDRLDDLPRLMDTLLRRVPSLSTPEVANDALLSLQAHRWPGNIRELDQVLTTARERAGSGPIRREHLPRSVQESSLLTSPGHSTESRTWTLDGVLESTERRLIQLAMSRANGSLTEAAAALGIFRTRLTRRIEALGLHQEPPRCDPPK